MIIKHFLKNKIIIIILVIFGLVIPSVMSCMKSPKNSKNAIIINVDFSSLSAKTIGNPFSSEWVYEPYTSAFYKTGYLSYVNKSANYYSSRFPWSKQIQLFQFTGGSDIKDFFTIKTDKNSAVDYSRAWAVIDTILTQGAIPMIKLGSVPKAFVAKPEYGAFNTQIRPPDAANWTAYYEYLYNFIFACHSRYPTAKNWKWCIFSEGNNWDWFKSEDANMTTTKNEFCKLYDYSVAAVKAVFGASYSNVGVHFVPREITNQCWDIDQFFLHAQSEANYFTGKVGSTVGFLEFSTYEKTNTAQNANQLAADMNYCRNRAQNHGFDNLQYGVGEGWLVGSIESGSSDIWSRQMGSVIANSYNAKLFRQALDNNVEWLSNPINGINNDDPGTIDAPFTVVMNLIDKMKDGKRAQVIKQGLPASARDDIDCVSVYDLIKHKIYILTYNHNPDYTSTQVEKITLILNNINSLTNTKVSVKEYNVSESNMSWWKAWWDEKGSLAPRINSVSKYDLSLWGSLSNSSDQKYFVNNKTKYQEMLKLTYISTEHTVSKDSVNLSLKLEHHGVCLYEISNVKIISK